MHDILRSGRDPTVIRLTVLGGTDLVDGDGRRLDGLLAQPRRVALLTMLAIESARGGVARERLMACFWPEHAPEQAASNLRQALAFLRRELGDGVILNQGRHALLLDRTLLTCDAVERLEAIAARDRARLQVAAGELLAGCNLAGAGEAWEGWLAEQRRRLAAPATAVATTPELPADPQARTAYLHGRFFWTRRPRESAKALAALQRAVALAPDFALGHAALADVYSTLGSWESGALPPDEAFAQAQQAAQRALALDPHCAPARTALGYATAHYRWHWQAAEHEFGCALALDPHYAHAHHWHAHVLVATRRFDDALAAGLRALELAPLDVIINVHLAWHHWLARAPERAIEQADRTAHLDETDHWPPFFRGMACAQCGRDGDAVDALRDACRLSAGNAVMRAGLGYAYAVAGERRQAAAILREFDAAAQTQRRFAYEAAVIHATLGDRDAAFERLDLAARTHSGWLAYVAVDPRLDPLRADPRYPPYERLIGVGPAA